MMATRVASESRPTPLIAVSVETLAYCVIFIFTCIFRAIALDAIPLGENEARHALTVQHLVNPLRPAIGQIENPVTFGMMALSMGVMGLTDAAARIMPMLAGIGLVFIPLLFRDRLGRLPALVASALLAISPIAVGLSRQVEGTIFAAVAFIVVIAALDRYLRSSEQRLLIIAGIAFGVALMADHTTLLAALALIAGVVFAAFTDEEGELDFATLREQSARFTWHIPLIAMAITILVAGSLLFLAPEGLGAAADQLGRFAQGVVSRTSGASWVGLALIVYEFGTLIFGLAGIWLASKSTLAWQRMLAGWGFASLLIILIYPGALPGHALWILLPLSALGGLTIATILSLRTQAPRWAAWLHAALVVAFFGMIFASLSQYLESPRMLPFTLGAQVPGQPAPGIPVDLILVVAWSIFLVIMWLFFANMWDTRLAWRGFGIGLMTLTALVSLGQAGSLAFSRAHSPYEPLNILPAQPGLIELVETIDDIGDLSIGSPVDPSITVQGEHHFALMWALRNQSNLTFTPDIDPTVQTDIVITPADGVDPALGSAYVGQDFVIVRGWQQRGLKVGEFIQWLLYRVPPDSAPPTDYRVILWVREDLYRLVPAGGEPE